MEIQKQLAESLVEAEKYYRNADHLIYITYPVVKDKKILLRALESCHKSAVKIISLILKYEYLHKKISLTSSPEKNLESFFEKCAKRYSLDEKNISCLRELMQIAKKHKTSTMEFSKPDKTIILSEQGEPAELRLESLKNYTKILKNLIESASANIKKSF